METSLHTEIMDNKFRENVAGITAAGALNAAGEPKEVDYDSLLGDTIKKYEEIKTECSSSGADLGEVEKVIDYFKKLS